MNVITVIIPVYNNVKFIERSIKSALYNSVVQEVIVVDDGSTDGTRELLELLFLKYPNLRVLHHPNNENKGIACSRNLGIFQAKTKWISFLDADDYYLENRFDYFISNSDSTCNVFFEPVINKVISEEGLVRFGEKNKYIHESIIKISSTKKYFSIFRKLYFGHGNVHINGIILTKKIAIASRLFDTNLNFAEDSIFRLKIAYNGIVNVNYSDYVAVRVIHDSNNEPNITKWDLYKKYTVLFNYFIEWKIDKSMLRNVIKRRIYYFLKCYSTRNYFLKSIYILRLIISDPRILLYYINF